MKRRIIDINEEKCTGCNLCVEACHEGAIQLVEGKARLIRDDYCDGLGDCLPACPEEAITFVEREALPYDEAAVQEAQKSPKCPSENFSSSSAQWPIQIKLVPTQAPYYDKADLLVAADCAAFVHPSFKKTFAQKKTILIGCPKLDNIDYSEKLAEILSLNDVKSIHIMRMEVPCCKGLELAVSKAIEQSGKSIPVETHIMAIEGEIKGGESA